MADIIDEANDLAQQLIDKKIEQARKLGVKLTPKQHCYYCLTKFEESEPHYAVKLFCNSDCANDYEKEEQAKRRNGK